MWQNLQRNSHTNMARKLKKPNGDQSKNNSNGDKTEKTHIVTKLKKLKFWQNSKTKIVTKLKNSIRNWDSNKILTKLNNSKCDKTQIVTKLKLWPNSKCDNSKRFFTKNILTPQQRTRYSLVSNLRFSRYFLLSCCWKMLVLFESSFVSQHGCCMSVMLLKTFGCCMSTI